MVLTAADQAPPPGVRAELEPFRHSNSRLGLTYQGGWRLYRRGAYPARVLKLGGRLFVIRRDIDDLLAGKGAR